MIKESNVRYYSESFPATFTTAHGSFLYDNLGRRYIDFFAGSGSLNYGHNHPEMIDAVVSYLKSGGVLHSLDMETEARNNFIAALSTFFEPLPDLWKIFITGPTGTNAVEAAFKICRRFTGRTDILAFHGGYHGMSLGALAATSSYTARLGAGVSLPNVRRIPYPTSNGSKNLNFLESFLMHQSSRKKLPAAIVFETIQAEGGVNLADNDWLNGVNPILEKFGVLCIVDDIQMGCGRTGPFLSFFKSSLVPDVICMSKSLSGIGLPLAAVIFNEKFDCLSSGQHSGTFRGPNLAFIAGSRAIEIWHRDNLLGQVEKKALIMKTFLENSLVKFPYFIKAIRGSGLIWGVEMQSSEISKMCARNAFSLGLMVERCGKDKETFKLCPPINISENILIEGLQKLETAIEKCSTT